MVVVKVKVLAEREVGRTRQPTWFRQLGVNFLIIAATPLSYIYCSLDLRTNHHQWQLRPPSAPTTNSLSS